MKKYLDSIEKIAELSHDIWSEWMKFLLLKSKNNENGDLVIPKNLLKRWKRQSNTKYKALPEQEKASDRFIAEKYFKIFLDEFEIKELDNEIKNSIKENFSKYR